MEYFYILLWLLIRVFLPAQGFGKSPAVTTSTWKKTMTFNLLLSGTSLQSYHRCLLYTHSTYAAALVQNNNASKQIRWLNTLTALLPAGWHEWKGWKVCVCVCVCVCARAIRLQDTTGHLKVCQWDEWCPAADIYSALTLKFFLLTTQIVAGRQHRLLIA